MQQRGLLKFCLRHFDHMVYLTFNDAPTGIYIGQVIDVVKFIRKEFDIDIKLVSIISVRGYFHNRKIIKTCLPYAIVLPMFPKLRNWYANRFVLYLLSIFIDFNSVIVRGIFACNLAFYLSDKGRTEKVCYDGRGAVTAEYEEYDVVKDAHIKKQVRTLEKKSVQNANISIAVSSKLVQYWQEKLGYKNSNHIIIPCTLSSDFQIRTIEEVIEIYKQIRSELGYTERDVIFVYSGSVSGWQSFELANHFLRHLFSKGKHYKVLFLTKDNVRVRILKKEFPNQIMIKWLEHDQVQRYLCACDYGLLIREKSVTNNVAAPTKFAEYLASGLKVLISDNVGDYSDFTRQHDCGYILQDYKSNPFFEPLTEKERENMINLADMYFNKKSKYNLAKYKLLVNALS